MTGVTVHELTLRDGLMSQAVLPVEDKLKLARQLVDLGFRELEVLRLPMDSAYPQFDDGLELLQGLQQLRASGVRLAALAMGAQGVQEVRGLEGLLDEVHVPCFVSQAYASYALQESSWDETRWRLDQARQLCAEACMELTVGLGTVFGCPIAGPGTVQDAVARVLELAQEGYDHIMLGDTAGTATPARVARTVAAVRGSPLGRSGSLYLRCHFHNTFGRALLNSLEAVRAGVDGVDTSLLGLGGEGHKYFVEPDLVDNGNCATEELCGLLGASDEAMAGLFDLGRWLATRLSRPARGRSAFAELVPMTKRGPDEVQRPTYRH